MSKFREAQAYVRGQMMAPPDQRTDAPVEGWPPPSGFAEGFYNALGDVMAYMETLEQRDKEGTPDE